LPYQNNFFDRVLAIHVLEHLPNLPIALSNFSRILKDNGRLSVVIPCEGGWAYSLARNISARPHFEKKYGQSYDWFVASEHINLPNEILEELDKYFQIEHRYYYPLKLPSTAINLAIGLTFSKRNKS
jgi:ubiquinone/menaquinone biosynthesis C-methylase UbiE